MRRRLRTMLEVEDEGSENIEKYKESHTQNQPSGKSSIVETSFPSDQVVNISSSFAPFNLLYKYLLLINLLESSITLNKTVFYY